MLILAASIVGVTYAAKRIIAANAGYSSSSGPHCQPATLNRSAVLPGTSISVSPLPDSLDASPRTQIGLLGEPVGALSHVSVNGSHTGVHAGRLVGYSQHDGASFVPTRPFSPRETVTVRGRVTQAGRTVPFAYRFTVAELDPIPHQPSAAPPKAGPGQVQSFHSSPGLHPPTVDVTHASAQATPGYIFAAPYSGPAQTGPMIFDQTGQLIWTDPLPLGTFATDLQVQTYEGQPALSWWQGYIPPNGFGEGEEIIANSHYQQIAHIHAGNGYQADLHDFHLEPNNTALLTIFDPIHCDLSLIGGPRNGDVTDAIFQELDLKTHLVRREWHSLDHSAISESYASPQKAEAKWPYDYFHINSVSTDPDGSTLISARNTWGVYKLNTQTGQIMWTLGGKHSSFHMRPGTVTAYQHDAAELPDGTITILDNGGVPKVHPQSRAIEISLNMQTETATLVREYEHSPPLSNGSQANFQTLPDGDAFIGWEQPYFSEYSPKGQVLFDAHMPQPTESYRAYKFEWAATPAYPPSVAAESHSGGLTVYASWNGATEVAQWRVLAGASPQQLTPVASATRSGFETTITTPSQEAYLAVQALNGAGEVIGTSPTIKS